MLSKTLTLVVLIATLHSCNPVLAQVKAPNHLVQSQLRDAYVGHVTTQHQSIDVRLMIYNDGVNIVTPNHTFHNVTVKPQAGHSYCISFKDTSNDVVFNITFYDDMTASGTVSIYANGILTDGIIQLRNSKVYRR